MTDLRIDTTEFKRVCRMVRSEMGMFDSAEESIYSFYRFFVRDQEDKFLDIASANPADMLRSDLRVAAQACQQFGATTSQIDYIVSLATKNNDFNVLSGGRLTKVEASRIIDVMKNNI